MSTAVKSIGIAETPSLSELRAQNAQFSQELDKLHGKLQQAYAGMSQFAGASTDTALVSARASVDIESLSTSMGKIAGRANAMLEVAGSAAKVGEALYTASAQTENLRTRLDLATGGKGAQELAYVTALADRLGLQLNATGQAYADFATKARGTALEGAQVQTIFTGIASANAAMGLSVEQGNASLAAVLDLMGKGTIGASDFSEKLGHIPDAALVGAQALGVTQERFSQMLQTGEVVTQDFLPRFSQALQSSLGEGTDKAADRLDAGTQRMANAWDKLKSAVGDSGISQMISFGMNAAANDMNAFSESMSRARDNGSGFLGQISSGLGNIAGRAVGLQYISTAFQSNAEKAAYLAKELPRARAELEMLQAKGAATSRNVWVRTAHDDAQRLVEKLQQVQRELMAAQGQRNAGGGRGFINPPLVGQPQEQSKKTDAPAQRKEKPAVPRIVSYAPPAAPARTQQDDEEIKRDQELQKRQQEVAQLVKEHQTKAGLAEKNLELARQETLAIGLTGDALGQLRQEQVEKTIAELQDNAAKQESVRCSKDVAEAVGKEADATRELARVKGYNDSARMVAEYAQSVKEANEATQFEQSLAAMSQRDREIALAQYRIEIDLQKKLQDIAAKNPSDAAAAQKLKEDATAAANQAKANVAERTRMQETQKSVDQMDEMFRKGFADMLANGTEGWRTFTKNLSATFKATVADEMYKAFAQPFVVPVIASIQGMIGNLFKMPGGAGAAGGGEAALLSSGQSLWSAFSGGLTGAVGNGFATMGAMFGSSAATAFGSGIAAGGHLGLFGGAMGQGMTLLGSGAAGSTAAGLGTMLGAALPWVAGAMALFSIAGSFGSRGPNHAGAAYSTAGVGNDKAAEQLFGRAAGDWYDDLTQRHSDAVEKQLKTSLDGLASVYGSLSKYATGSARGIDLVGGFAANGKYTDEDAYGYAKIIDKTTGMILAGFENRSLGNNPEEAYKAFLGQTGSLLVSELKKADLPSWMRTTLDSLGEAPNVEALQAAFQTIDLIGRSFEELGKKITGFADLTDLAFESLIKASGGIEALNANAGSFYQNFYSEDERKTIAKREMGSKLKDLGVDIDLDADDAQARFRKLVEDKLKAANSEEANAKVLKDAISKVQGTQGLKDMAKTGAFKDWASTTLGEGSGDIGKLAADLENLANTSTSLADFTAGMDKLIGDIGGTGKSSAETAAELLKLNDTFKAVTKTSEDAAAASAKQAEEAKRKQEEQAQEAKKKNEADTDAAWSLLQRSVDAERSAIQARIDVAQERVDTERALMDTLRGHVVELRGQIESTQAMALARANEVIDQALAAYRRTGYLPESADIGEAVSAARGGISSGNFRSRLDYEAAQLILANKLEVLHDAAGEQLSADELILEQEKSQVDALDRLLKTEKEALDIARGIDTRLLSSDLAWAEFRAALLKESVGHGSAGDLDGADGKSESGFGPGGGDGSGADRAKRIAETYRRYEGTGDVAGLVRDIKAAGGTAKDIANLGGYALGDVNAVLDQMGIPRFARGGDHAGGVRMVGELGPELEFTGPSRIYSAQRTQQLFAGMGGGETSRQIQALHQLIFDIGRQQIVLLHSMEGLARKADALGIKRRVAA
ncbi:tape measure protein [Delftia tsuruhatensis]|uniref:tape measure protein n=1 Tax=Delftia tsuruhatensis TaxID=180282 RepID=UPI002443DB91|nr:tape measure protein [Delftia tsuruhatensis]MDH0772216.1 tape measure protein [Delftia tsuruhatensis]MDH1456264.1 tape measure protein [Delftia tsuruhatensis]MDH1825158.1 tape measure protein [Delftia tsuruhatensis]WGG10335.1 tape measure protein [Delftia tsuruhatensis]